MDDVARSKDDQPEQHGTDSAAILSRPRDRVAMLVLGMHRSGTSALTRVLSLAGAALPHEMIDAVEGNRTGHWESRDIVLTNDRVLEAAGLAWSDWQAPDWTAMSLRERAMAEEDIRRVVEAEFGDADLIVIKDPRICRLVPSYLSALQEGGYHVLPVITFRHPLEVMRSLQARSNWPKTSNDIDAALLWLSYTLEAEHATRHLVRVVISYDRTFTDWQELLHDLENCAGITLPHRPETITAAVDEFLTPSERHHQINDAKLAADALTMGWVRKAYDALRQLERDPGSVSAQKQLDEIRHQFEAAQPMLRRALEERTAANHAEEQARKSVTDTTMVLAETQEKFDKAQGRITELETEREALKRHFSIMLQAQETQLMTMLSEQDQRFRSSRSWRLTAPLRSGASVARRLRNTTRGLQGAVAEMGGMRATLAASTRIIRKRGVRSFISRFKKLQGDRYRVIPDPVRPEGGDDIVNHMAVGRGDVLLSDWHVALTRALWDKRPAEADGPTLGLSIVTYNSARWLPGFLTSLTEQNFPLSRLNVAIVDHGSQDETVALIEEHATRHGHHYGSFTLYPRPNLGFGAGHDFAIRQLEDDLVLVTNVDLKFHEDTLVRAQRAAHADLADVAAWEVRQCPYEHPKYYDPVTLEAVWNSHACVLFRREAYLGVGGYDERIFMYGEDVELSYRFRGAGWRLRYLPQISVTHFVDLDDTTARPKQLSGSLAANILLRYRYGGDEAGAEGERLLAEALSSERDPIRRMGMVEAQRRVLDQKQHFRTVFKPAQAVDFPFAGFDYIFTRNGEAVPLDSSRLDSDRPLVSIVTRTFGPKIRILREALAAVINQTYPNIEHLIVEDRTDFAGDLIAEVAEAYGRNIRYMKSDGSGRSEAGNFGLSQAAGELLMFLDNDDLLFCDHVEQLQTTLMHAPGTVAAYALAWDVQTRFGDDGSYHEFSHILLPGHRQPYDHNRMNDMNFIPIQAIIFRRSLYEAEGGFDISIDHLEDWNLWSRYSNHGPFEMVPKVTSMYRTPTDPKVRSKRQRELDAAYDRVRAINAEHRREAARSGAG